ncbi:MAG: hypothetical protein SNJ82_09295 [Gemmataceae bacterium]
MSVPQTIIIRHRKEIRSKCTIWPLRGRDDIRIVHYPVRHWPELTGYVRLAAEGPPLTRADALHGLLLLDGSWRWAGVMAKHVLAVEPRSLSGWQTAYPRSSKLGTDPDNGLASIEALYLAYRLLGRPTTGLLDHYPWAEAFLQVNRLQETVES